MSGSTEVVVIGGGYAVTREAMQFGDGREPPSTVTTWTAGLGVPDPAGRSVLSIDAAGRLLTTRR